ncbi:MAG: hypothetical protein M1828_004298 [Chrysothrix sp. TS-e1954]|nr:MAG: hypothetical protein M1828_004298 [Chrysothrix sp. TS-e1954]
MDIRQWIRDTAAPDVFQPTGAPQKESRDLRAFAKRQSKRQSNSTDGFSIEPDPRFKTSHRGKRPRPRYATSSSSSSSGYGDGSDSITSSSRAHSERFERRPRHKTRDDLYDLNSGARKRRTRRKEPATRQKKKSRNGTYHKTKRPAEKHKESGRRLVDAFKANNVQNERITLKPRHGDEGGVFGKGVASRPVRGQGLPDLTFTEMRFLQNPRNEDVLEKADARRSRKYSDRKKRSKSKDEELAAFFQGQRAPASKSKKRDRHKPHDLGRSNAEHVSQAAPANTCFGPASSTAVTSGQAPLDVLPRPLMRSETPYTSTDTQQPRQSPQGFGRALTAINVGQLQVKHPAIVERNDSYGIVKQPVIETVPTYDGAGCAIAPPQKLNVENHASEVPRTEEQRQTPKDPAMTDHVRPCTRSKTSSPLKKMLQACDSALDRVSSAPTCRQSHVDELHHSSQPHYAAPMDGTERGQDEAQRSRITASQEQSLYRSRNHRGYSGELSQDLDYTPTIGTRNPKHQHHPDRIRPAGWHALEDYVHTKQPRPLYTRNALEIYRQNPSDDECRFYKTQSLSRANRIPSPSSDFPRSKDENDNDGGHEDMDEEDEDVEVEPLLNDEVHACGDTRSWEKDLYWPNPTTQLAEPSQITPVGFWRPNKLY